MDLGLEQNGFEHGGELAIDSALPQTLTPNPSPTLDSGDSGETSAAVAPCHTLTPGPSPMRERGVDPLELIAEGRHSVESICRASKMSILDLAEYVCTPRNLEALARVGQLHAIEQEMMLGKLKRKALGRLAELTEEVAASSADEIRASEVMRKACVDLLRYGGLNTEKRPSRVGEPGGGGPRARGYHSDSITPAFEAEVLEALEKLGEERIEDELLPEAPEARAAPVAPAELATCTNAPGIPGMPGMPGTPAPPQDGLIGHGQSRHCPCHPGGRHEGHAVPGTKHGIVGLDHAHPP